MQMRYPVAAVLVMVGGTVGTLARYLIDTGLSADASAPVGIAVINVTGALALGLLLGWSPTEGGPRPHHLLLGTGFLGGYTTYSALAVDVVGLIDDGSHALALAYGVGSVIAGFLAAGAGYVVMRSMRGRRG